MKLALIGLGKWGQNIERTLKDIPGVEVEITDNSTSPQPSPYKGEGVSGVIVATPGSTHFDVAMPFVKMGLPVFIEKPMTTSLVDAKKLVAVTRKSKAIIQVGHIHLFNPAYLKAKELVKKIGKIRLLYFEGMAPGPVRDDMSVWWDWGPHGVSMALDLLGKMPDSVQAWGMKLLEAKKGFDDVVQARLLFSSPPVEVLLTTSWVSPEKRTKMMIIGSKGSVIFDDRASAGKKVALYQSEKVSYSRYGQKAPLELELAAFVKTIRTGQRPIADIDNGLAVIEVLAAAEKSIQR